MALDFLHNQTDCPFDYVKIGDTFKILTMRTDNVMKHYK